MFLTTIGFIAVVMLLTVLHGMVLHVLWGWFFVPLGLHAISTVSAMGISLTVRTLTSHYQRGDVENEEYGKQMLAGFLIPIIALAIGWLIHLCQ